MCLCGAAKLRLCADGGANRVYDEMPRLLADQDENDVRNWYLISILILFSVFRSRSIHDLIFVVVCIFWYPIDLYLFIFLFPFLAGRSLYQSKGLKSERTGLRVIYRTNMVFEHNTIQWFLIRKKEKKVKRDAFHT